MAEQPIYFDLKLALSAVAQLQDVNLKNINLDGQEIPRQECLIQLNNYLQVAGVALRYKPSVQLLKKPDFLELVKTALNTAISEQPSRLKELENLTNPTEDQKQAWILEMRAHEQNHSLASQRAQTAGRSEAIIKEEDFAQHIQTAQRFRARIELTVAQHIDPFWQDDERTEIVTNTAEKINRAVISRLQEAQEQLGKTGTTQENHERVLRQLNEEFFNEVLTEIRQESPELSVSLPQKQLAQTLKNTMLVVLTPEEPSRANRLIQAHQVINNVTIAGAPERTQLIQRVSQELGLNQQQAEHFVNLLETNFPPNHIPTAQETKKAVKKTVRQMSTTSQLRLATSLHKENKQLDEQLTSLVASTRAYYLAIPLSQPENSAEPVSSRALAWAKKLKTEPVVIEQLLRGTKLEDIDREITRLKKLGKDTFHLEQLRTKVAKIEPEFNKLPRRLRNRINLARLKLDIYRSLPFTLEFYRYRTPRLAEKLRTANERWLYLKKDHPLTSWIFSPLRNLRKWQTNFHKARWQAWDKLLNKFIKHKGLNNFLYHLPKRYFTYWLSPSRILRRTSGRILLNLGVFISKRWKKYALGRFCRDFGRLLLNNTFKQIFKTGFKSLLSKIFIGTIIGGPVGTAISIVTSVITFLFSKKNREFLKTLLSKAKDIASKFFIGLAGFIAAFPMVFAGMALGYILLGPAGALLGGTLGFIIPQALASIKGAFSALAGGFSAAGSFLPSLAGSLPTMSAISLTGIIATGSAIGFVTIGTIVSLASYQSIWFQPPEQEAGIETQWLTINKTASFSTQEIAPGTIITYKITVTLGAESGQVSSVVDTIDQNSLENIVLVNSDPAGSYNVSTGQITWPGFSMQGMGTIKTFSYTATVKNNYILGSPIQNTVIATALINEQQITRQASLTLNGTGDAIAKRAKEIIASLERRFWDYFNYSSIYPELFDNTEFTCCDKELGQGTCQGQNYLPTHNHCYLSNTNPECCFGDPKAIQAADSMFWCTWLVIKSYNETGHQMPALIGVSGMQSWFESKNKFLPPTTNVSQLEEGDVIFFKKGSSWAHVGVICDLTDRDKGITVCEANNYQTSNTYNVEGGIVQGTQTLTVAGFGEP